MFTGLVEKTGIVTATSGAGPGRRLEIDARFDSSDARDQVRLGDSVAINGCCLTVIAIDGGRLSFEAGPETLAKTSVGRLSIGSRVNLERSLPANGRLGGHVVQGHVDGLGRLTERVRDGEWEYLTFAIGALTRYLVPKGSIAIDGVSLTVVDVRGETFRVALIPHTLAVTTLGELALGAEVNIETDVMGRYVVDYLDRLGLTRLLHRDAALSLENSGAADPSNRASANPTDPGAGW